MRCVPRSSQPAETDSLRIVASCSPAPVIVDFDEAERDATGPAERVEPARKTRVISKSAPCAAGLRVIGATHTEAP
jgi:hypothetical protein